MAVSYKKLFKLLIDRNMKKKDLRKLTGISYSTMTKLENGENIMMDVAERICLKLNCQLSDIAEIIPEESPDYGTANRVVFSNEVSEKK
jgi:DNA-binding Xre family transcriptional regulator